MRARWIAALVLLALPAAASAQSPPEQTPQALFEGVILADPNTTTAVANLLRADAGHVSPRPAFADLTGDEREDAVVTVHNAGVAGVVAVFVLSADGTEAGRLRVIFASQSLYRARPVVADTTLTIRQPRYVTGDELCCPMTRIDRDYSWDGGRKRLRHRATRVISLRD